MSEQLDLSKLNNPANVPQKAKVERQRIPMSMPLQKLAVPDIPGYHLHWMLGTPGRISQALRAGYEFVDGDDVDVTNTGLANDASSSGNSDLGSRISVLAGLDSGETGEQRLYLMKLKEEYWQEDQKLVENRNEQIAAALRGGEDVAENPNGSDNRYIPDAQKKTVAELFTPKSRRS